MMMLTLDQANVIIAGALAHAADEHVPPLTVVVLDAAGDLVATQRQDGASMFRFDIALGKAWGAVAMGVSSRTLASRAADNPNFFAALASTARGRFIPQPGATPIMDADGRLIGAVGASGGTGDQDEACVAAGIRAVGLVPGD
jgi:uncharacterized protein GlcG (DUF336 family)